VNAIAPVEERKLTPSQQFRAELDRMNDQFAAALPSHIKPEKFARVVMTAVLSDPAILQADRQSLLESAIRAAQDGLLPDKREGAFVVFNAKVNGEWIKKVQWMPMIAGIIKRVQQSGEIKMLTARVVYGGDHFRTWIDDQGEHVEYEPSEEQDTDTIRRVFAMATTTDGAVYVEPLSAKDVEKIRSVSRSKDKGPWVDWWEEMAKKSAIRRLAKRLPLSTDLHDLIRRDDGFYDLSQVPEPAAPLQDRLAARRIAGPAEGFTATNIIETDAAEVVESEPAQQDDTTSHDGAASEEPELFTSGVDGSGSSEPATDPQSGGEDEGQDDASSAAQSEGEGLPLDVLEAYSKTLWRAGSEKTLKDIAKVFWDGKGGFPADGKARDQALAINAIHAKRARGETVGPEAQRQLDEIIRSAGQ